MEKQPHDARCCATLPTPRILVLLQLAASGERERLKSLLRDRLVECGWKEDVTRHARGALLPAV